MRTIGLLLLILAGLWSGTGCTYLLYSSATKDVDLPPGTRRAEVIKTLGPPLRSQTFRPAVAGSTFADAPAPLRRARVSLCDDYRPNSLVLVPDHNPYQSFTENYMTGMVFTLGLGEIVFLPVHVVYFSQSAGQHYDLRLWYDGQGRLLAERARPRYMDER